MFGSFQVQFVYQLLFFLYPPSLYKAKLIDGNAIAKQIRDEVKAEVDLIKASGKRPPRLAVVLVGSDPASVVYVRNKIKACEYTGNTLGYTSVINSSLDSYLLCATASVGHC